MRGMLLRMYPDEDFQAAVQWLLAIEGGYANDPADPGGETKFGISKRSYPDLDIGRLTEDQAWAIYYNDYWVRAGCDHLRAPIAWALFDAAVQHGVKRAVTMLQIEAGGLRIDGINGPKTQAKINERWGENATSGQLLAKYLTHRARLYHDLVTANSERARFLNGWLKRLFLLQAAIYENHLHGEIL